MITGGEPTFKFIHANDLSDPNEGDDIWVYVGEGIYYHLIEKNGKWKSIGCHYNQKES